MHYLKQLHTMKARYSLESFSIHVASGFAAGSAGVGWTISTRWELNKPFSGFCILGKYFVLIWYRTLPVLNPLPPPPRQLFILIFLESEFSLPFSQCLFMSHRLPLARRMKNVIWLFSNSERGTSSSGLAAEEPGSRPRKTWPLVAQSASNPQSHASDKEEHAWLLIS